MKKIIFSLVVSLFFISCTNNVNEEGASNTEYQSVSLSFFQTSISSMDGAKSMSSRVDEETSKSLASTEFTNLDVVVYPTYTSYTKTFEVHQTKTDASSTFGSVSINLPVGDYILVAVASKCTNLKFTSQNEIEFPDKVTDMGFIRLPISVKKGSNSFSGILQRCVSKFKLTNNKDSSPNATSLKFHISGNCSNKFNPSSGNAVGTSGVEPTVTISSNKSHSVYVFLSSDEEKQINVSVDVLNSQNAILKTLTFDNVTLKKNCCTEYTGGVFTQDNTAAFTFTTTDFQDSGAGKDFGQ